MSRRNAVRLCSNCVLFTLMLILVISQIGYAAEKTYKWKLGQPYTKGTLQWELVEDWINRIQDASNGRIIITHYPGELLGGYVVQAEAVARGAQEITLTWPTTGVAGPGADLSLMGYVFRTWDDFSVGMTGWMYKMQKDLYKQVDWEVLGSLPDGMLIMVSTKKFDPMPGPKELKIRLMPTETVQVRYRALGFRTLSMPMSEFATAMSLGTVDAGGNVAWSEAWYNYKDVIKYVYNSQDMTSALFLIMNKSLFASLSEADQKMITDISLNWTRSVYAAIKQENEKYRQQLIAFGVEIVDFTDKQWVANAKVGRAKEWPLMEKKVGKAIMDVVRQHAFKLD